MDNNTSSSKRVPGIAGVFIVVLVLLTIGWIFFILAENDEPAGSDTDVREQVAPERTITDVDVPEQPTPEPGNDGR